MFLSIAIRFAKIQAWRRSIDKETLLCRKFLWMAGRPQD